MTAISSSRWEDAPQEKDEWENRDFFDDGSQVQDWQPYGRSTKPNSGKSNSAKSVNSSSTGATGSSSGKSDSTVPVCDPLCSRSLDKYLDDARNDEDLFTTVCHESAEVRSKRRVSIMDYGNSSGNLETEPESQSRRPSLDKSLGFAEPDPFDSCPAFGSNGFEDADVTDILPVNSTETMTGAPSPVVASPPDVSPRSVAATDVFGTPFHEMKMPAPGQKRLSMTRRVDFTGGIAQEEEQNPAPPASPGQLDELAPSSIKREDLVQIQKTDSENSMSLESVTKGESHSSKNTKSFSKAVRGSHDFFPAWKLLQRERSRRDTIEPHGDEQASLSLSCHIRRTSSPPALDSREHRSVSSRSHRTFGMPNEDTHRAPEAPSKPKKSHLSKWPKWGSKSDPSLPLPPAFATIEEAFPSPKSTGTVEKKARFKIRPAEESKSDESLSSLPKRSVRKPSEDGKVLSTSSSKSKKSTRSKRIGWGSRSGPAIALPPAFANIRDSSPSPKSSASADKKKVEDLFPSPKSTSTVDKKKVRLVPKPAQTNEDDEVDSIGFPSPRTSIKPVPSTPQSCGGKPAWMKRMNWHQHESPTPEPTEAVSREALHVAATPTRRTRSAPAFPSGFFSPRSSKKSTIALIWTRGKVKNFSDYTISVVSDSPDGEKIEKETYYVHKSVVAIGPRGSGFILEKLGQRRAGGITTIVKLSPSAAKAVPLMLDYMYDFQGGAAQVTTETAAQLRYLADYFTIRPLFDEVNEFIQNDMNFENVSTYYAAAKELKDDNLAEATRVLQGPMIYNSVGEIPF